MIDGGKIYSNMEFKVSPYTFRIEEHDFWKNHSGMKSCEFITYYKSKNQLLFVEAKNSIVNPDSDKIFEIDGKVITSREKYEIEINEIVQKFYNSLNGLYGVLNRYQNKEPYQQLPDFFKHTDFSQSEFRLYLVINQYPKNCLPQILNKIQSKLSILCHEWNIPTHCVKVMNAEKALEKNIISDMIVD